MSIPTFAMADDKAQGVQTRSFDSLTLDDNENPLAFSPARRWTCTILGNWTFDTRISPASTDVEESGRDDCLYSLLLLHPHGRHQ